MALEPKEHRDRLLEQAREHDLVAPGDLIASLVGQEIVAAAVEGPVDAPAAVTPWDKESIAAGEGMHGGHGGGGGSLVELSHTAGTFLLVAAGDRLQTFTTRRHHLREELDTRSGAWGEETLGERLASWYPFPDGHEQGDGVLEVGDRRYLIGHGLGDEAAALAAAAQGAR